MSRSTTAISRRTGSEIDQPFEGKRVRVVLELVDEDVRLLHDEQAGAWGAWLKNGPDGPIADDGDAEFP
jgi:hypothetical protein